MISSFNQLQMSSSKTEITVEVEVHDELDKQTPCKDEPNVNHTLGKPTDVNEETQPLEHSGGPWPAGVNVETQPLGQSGEPADVNGEIQPLDHPDKPTNLSGGAHAQTQATNTTDQTRANIKTAAFEWIGPAGKIKYLESLKMYEKPSKEVKAIQKEIKQYQKKIKGLTKRFNIAMETGTVTVKNRSVMTIGAAGVGKTCAKNLILDLPPPEIRNSTGTQEGEPIRLVRNVKREMAQVNGTKWTKMKEIGGRDRLTAKFAFKCSDEMIKKTGRERAHSREKVVHVSTPQIPISPTVLSSSPPDSPKNLTSTQLPQGLIEDIREFVTDMMDTDGDFSQEATKLLGHDWIYFIDSGGQPQFHNLLPHFIQGLSTILIVIPLSEKLEDSPIAEYYENGMSIGSYESSVSTIDTLKCIIRSMQSYKTSDQKPKLLFIGTFYDQIKNPDSLEEKNQQLYDLFSEECLDQLVFRNSTRNELIFPINGKNPGEHEKEIVKKIRLSIESAPVQFESEIPIRWNMLEVFLEYTSTCLQRKVLSRAECLNIAHELKMTVNDSEDELTNALRHIHNMHLLHYYPHILPEVVFTSPQVILDKVTELVKEAYRLRDSSGSTVRKGIITTALLRKFEQHYVEGVFGPIELQKLFIEFLIITPISLPEEEKNCSNDKFFMPALLHKIPSGDLEKYRILEPIQPLVISFASGLILSGVFCCVQVYLMKELKWKLVCTDTEPEIIAQNCVMLAHPREPCTVTIIDSFSYIEVHVSSKPKNYPRVLPLIRESIVDGIKAANQKLRYASCDDNRPRLTFFCPCDQEVSANPPQRHLGELKEGNELQCSVHQRNYLDLNEKYTKWLGPVISGKPILPAGNILEIEHLWHIHEAVYDARAEWKFIGRALGIESTLLDSIHSRVRQDDNKENLYQVLERWIQSGEATMNRLLEALESKVIGKTHVANAIRAFTPEQKAQIGL